METLACMNANDLKWDDINLVLAICREGTLTGAARVLAINHSTVFRRITAIEEKLAVRLFERLPSGYVMTQAGEEMLIAGERMENEYFRLSRKLIGKDAQLSGALRITAPDSLTFQVLMPLFTSFCHQYPNIQISLSLANHFFNLEYRETDIAIRSTLTPPESMVGHRLCDFNATFYASGRYMADKKKAELAKLYWLMPNPGLPWFSANQWLEKTYPNAKVVFRCDTFIGLHAAAKDSLGIALLPCFLGDSDTSLERVIPPPKALFSELWLLIHPDLRHTARVATFVSYFKKTLNDRIDLLEGKLYQKK